MRTVQILRTTNLVSAGLVLFVIVISIAAGVSFLIFKSPLSPLIVAVGVLAPVLLVVLLIRPNWALYTAVFVVFLPEQVVGQLPIDILAKYLITLIVFFAGSLWLLNVVIWRRRIVWKSAILLMSGFVIWSIITLLWAPNLILARQMLMSILVGFFLLVMLVNQIDSAKALNGLLATLALIGWILVLAGVVTVLVKGYTPSTRLNILGYNENEFGINLLLAMPGVLWQAVRPEGRHRALKGLTTAVYLVLAIGLIAMSGSRGSAISLLVTLLAFCYWKPIRVWGVLGLIVLAMGVILAPLLFSITLERFAIMPGDTLLGGREALWVAAWNLILDHPLLGVGIGNARTALVPYVILLRDIGGEASAAAHNPVLQVWAETGLPGILLYLGTLGSAVILFVRQYFLRRKFITQVPVPYFGLISSLFLGYLVTWIKGGGIEFSFSFFFILSFLLIPSYLQTMNPQLFDDSNNKKRIDNQNNVKIKVGNLT